MDDGTADMDRRLAFAIERLSDALRSFAQRSAREHNLTPLQQQIVLALTRLPATSREVNALAVELHVTNPTVSDAVTALDRKELLVRTPGTDGRRRVLSLTKRGRDAAAKLESWDQPLMTALDTLPIQDRAATLDALLHVIASLHRQGAISVARTCTTCRFFRASVDGDPVAPHYCSLLQTRLRREELQVDCVEHELAA